MAITRVDGVRHTSLAVLVALVVALVGVAPMPARAAPGAVAVRDNSFEPREVHIDPGDSVIWSYEQGQNVHTVTSDERGQFSSGDMSSTNNPTFSHTFEQEGYYPYFCRYHGAHGGVGMAGMVILGDPAGPPPGAQPIEDAERPRLVVPSDYPTIQQAVDVAEPGSTVVIQPGTYRESVIVATPGLVIRGVDRFRSVLHGDDSQDNGVVVEGVSNVRVKNLTVRNYLHNGILLNDVTGYVLSGIDSIKNRTFGIHAVGSYKGVIRNSFGWGSGDSAFSIDRCLGCSTLIDNVHSEMNYLGYSGTNATGVIITNSTFTGNGAGIVPNTRPTEELGPNRGTTILDNRVVGNNYVTIPPLCQRGTRGCNR